MVSMAGVRDAISAAVDKMVDDWAQMRLVGSASTHLLLVPPPPTRAKDKKEVPAHPQEAVLGYVCNDKKCEKPCFYHQLQRGQGRRVNGGYVVDHGAVQAIQGLDRDVFEGRGCVAVPLGPSALDPAGPINLGSTGDCWVSGSCVPSWDALAVAFTKLRRD